MLKPLLLAAAAASLTACAAPRAEPVRHVFISGTGVHHIHSGDGRDRVVVIRRNGEGAAAAQAGANARRQAAEARRHAAEARRHAREAVRMARLARPDPADIERTVREARAQGEQARRMGELARRQGESARRQAEALRQNAERLRAQCERGEIQCEIIDNGGSRTVTIIR